jgi:hypothetical protein
MVLYVHRPAPALGQRSGERTRHEVGTATGPERFDQAHPARHVLLRGWAMKVTAR